MVRVNEGGNRLISVDVVRRQGTLGFVTLELETVSGIHLGIYHYKLV